ncbi:hypothetical protein OESDEN_06563 [Oesophagostomum dentatum]|uniref:SGNH domain-containing protein n=1 Tax=Oesophagostomum dentatum TaxID=61180 RepID=A0A0B1TDS9_OESDE|nr:hypothetical protein OESDEN_06563 [Oesophagostomum dentatum]
MKLLPDWIALACLKILGALSLLYHIKLPPSQAFNYVHTRLWQFVVGIYVHRSTLVTSSNTGSDAISTDKYADKRTYLYYLAGVFCTSFFVFLPLDSLIIRIISTFLTAGLILYYPHNEPLFTSSKYMGYLGNISYSLYLVHWPIFIFFKQNYIDDFVEQVLRLNELFTSADTYYLYYAKCAYRRGKFGAPWGWCDLPSKSSTPKRKILVIGNSYATNQGRLVYEMCRGSGVEVKIFTIPACEVLAKSTQYEHCTKSNERFLKVVHKYKPNVLFILVRYTDMTEIPESNSTTTIENVVKEASAILSTIAQDTSDHIFILDALPKPQISFMRLKSLAISSRKTIRPITLLNATSGVEIGRRRLAQVVSTCSKCSMIDYAPVFTFNGTFYFYEPDTDVAFMNGLYHFTSLGLHRLRPLFKDTCDSIGNFSKRLN